MAKLRNLTGQRFGRLIVIERAENQGKRVMWKCKCDCGSVITTRMDNLTRGGSQSCGCYNKERTHQTHTKHGESNTRLYSIHKKIKSRCYDSNNNRYSDYGGRGIEVCEEWQKFEPFRDWALANGYRDDLTIDRIDVDGNYEPSNCRWATNQRQQNNRRDNHYITYNGETHTIAEWAHLIGIKENTLVYRFIHGWDVERALTTPTATKRLSK